MVHSVYCIAKLIILAYLLMFTDLLYSVYFYTTDFWNTPAHYVTVRYR